MAPAQRGNSFSIPTFFRRSCCIASHALQCSVWLLISSIRKDVDLIMTILTLSTVFSLYFMTVAPLEVAAFFLVYFIPFFGGYLFMVYHLAKCIMIAHRRQKLRAWELMKAMKKTTELLEKTMAVIDK